MRPFRWPRDHLLNGAFALLGIWLVLHALGCRQCVSILSGTVPDGWTEERAALGAFCYLLAYFGAVLMVPALLLARLFFWLSGRFKSRTTSGNQ